MTTSQAYSQLVKMLDGPEPGEWHVKAGASVRTGDGYCYRATVYRNGRKVGQTFDQGCGGGLEIDIPNPADVAALTQYAAALPPCRAFGEGAPLTYNPEFFLGELGEISMDIKRLSRAAKTKTLFAEGGKTYTVNVPFSQDSQQRIASRHPSATFLNPLFAVVKGVRS